MEILFDLIEGDFRVFNGVWRIERISAKDGRNTPTDIEGQTVI